MALPADQGLGLRGREEATEKELLVISGHLWSSLAPACSVTHLDPGEREGAVRSSGTSSEA